MTTASQAYDVLRARLLANKPAGLSALRWQNEDADSNGDEALPNEPAPFAFVELVAERAGPPVSYGGGAGANRYRNPARLVIYVFVPAGAGLTLATDLAEACATLFRSYRDADVSCFDATVHPGGTGAEITPPGLSSEVGNYFYAVAEIALFFDLIG